MCQPAPDSSPASSDGALFAIVVVFTPLSRRSSPTQQPEDGPVPDDDHLVRSFHYHVPESLRGSIRPGQLVWVPFKSRHLQGIVVALDDHSPVKETKPIEQIVDPEPVLSAQQIALAGWIAQRYLAPVHFCIATMFPSGLIQQIDTMVQALPGADLGAATEAQRMLYSLLLERGPLELGQIARTGERKGWRSVVNQLVRRGWASSEVVVRPPTVRPKRVPVVRATLDWTDAKLPGASARRQNAALAWLQAHRSNGNAWVPLSDAAAQAGVSAAALRALHTRGLVELDQREVWRDPLAGKTFVPVTPPALTSDQECAWQAIAADLEQPGGKPFLLQGVTGSGKTEIYLRAVRRTLVQGRGAIVLVPEIALTPQTIRRFGARFPSTLAVMHSKLSLGELYDQWRRVRAGELRLVIGPRSALFAPVSDLGLIVLDEEHEWSYKQERMPRYHARDVAVQLARMVGATCILGSATPDLESAYRAERGEYVRLSMPQRIMGHRQVIQEEAGRLCCDVARFQAAEVGTGEALYTELPPVQVVDMRAELRDGNTSMFSRSLQESIAQVLAAGEQSILFLNRRGAATFVMCRDCGHVPACPRCDIPLTYHSAESRLLCHHCGVSRTLPATCPVCGSARIRHFGAGTERVEDLVRQTFPRARTVRWDLDTTGGKQAHERILDRFIQGQADIMIGTQMVAKGLDLPKVTLVGVITADTLLNLPDFRAGERTLQLLMQVAGRAGRSILGGRVIIQTYAPQHPAIVAACTHDYESFYQQEMTFRREHWYPPLSRIVQLVCADSNAEAAQAGANEVYAILANRIARLGVPNVDLIGPTPAFFQRLAGKWRWQILVRGDDPCELLRAVQLSSAWSVDVDPASLL
ncbi:MAG: replication restart helicase PriA [Anaerolineae bacterium]